MAEQKAKQATTDAEQLASDMVPKAQYDNLLVQVQAMVDDANAKIDALSAYNKLLSDTLTVQNKLIERFLSETK